MKKLRMLHLLQFAVLLAFGSCQKEQLDEKNFKIKSRKESLDNIKSQKGILTFRNMSEFEFTIKALENAKESDRMTFESRLGFQSLRSAYTIASKHVPQNDDKSVVNTSNSTGLIVEKDGKMILNFFDDKMASVLTKEGHVIIGFTFHQFSNREVKSIELSEDIRIADAINVLQNVDKSNSKVRVSPVKSIDSRLSTGEEQGARVGIGGYEIFSPWGASSGEWRYCVRGKVGLNCYDWQSTTCEYYDWDEDCRCNSCRGEITTETGRRLFVSILAESLYRSSSWGQTVVRREAPIQAQYTKATGNLTVFYDGRSFSYPVNIYGGSTSYISGYILDNYYSDVQNVSTVQVEGNITYEVLHATNGVSRVTQYL